ncbi:transcriptional regulator [Psychromonas sp. CNPT3]|uniref:MurR/RpiR family transcriptional regulator n=1 Tax=Psychromonas sp. CNPT3 TaxID=314282 RepID=UPI00006E5094|nr:MurR/RpiR family transcriptional regulator [Psychromonas sp. CNPT3]AGH82469.1 transcriptional regulator [Psychromonas sp. CNPT3]
MLGSQEKIRAGKVLDTISSLYASLTPSSKRISDYILSNGNEACKLSIGEISKIVNVGDATIIRFCRTLGFKGFQEFKMELAIEFSHINQQDKSIFDGNVTADDDVQMISQKLKRSINNVLSETINLLDFNVIEEITAHIVKAEAIYFFGVGSSGLVAESAKHKFMRIGLRVDALTNNHFMYMQASLLKKGDIVIGISHSGYSSETIKALTLAKEAGAVIIAITHNPRSTLGELADHVLVNGNRQGKLQGDSIGTKISQMFVLDLLYTAFIKEDIEHAEENKLKTTQALKAN